MISTQHPLAPVACVYLSLLGIIRKVKKEKLRVNPLNLRQSLLPLLLPLLLPPLPLLLHVTVRKEEVEDGF